MLKLLSSSPKNKNLVYAFSGLMTFTGLAAFTLFKKGKAKEEEFALDPKQFKQFTLAEVYPVSHNTRRYRFAFQEDQKLGLEVASCLVLKAPIGEDGKDVIRPYTPVSDPEDRGFFDLVVKSYPNGIMSKHLAQMIPGQKIEAKGPFEKIKYTPNMKKKIGMIAGGTGITPMYQVINEILKNSQDKTEISLLFANNTEEDILLKYELDLLAKRHKNFKVNYVVIEANTSYWKGDLGFVTADLVKKYLPNPSDENLILVCGPPPMMKAISGDKAPDYSQGELQGILKGLNYKESQVFKF